MLFVCFALPSRLVAAAYLRSFSQHHQRDGCKFTPKAV